MYRMFYTSCGDVSIFLRSQMSLGGVVLLVRIIVEAHEPVPTAMTASEMNKDVGLGLREQLEDLQVSSGGKDEAGFWRQVLSLLSAQYRYSRGRIWTSCLEPIRSRLSSGWFLPTLSR